MNKKPASDLSADIDPGNAEAVAAELARKRTRLRFADPALEQHFRSFFQDHNRIPMRVSLLVFMLLVGVFGLTDLLNFPMEIARQNVAIRLGVIVPVLLWVFWCTFRYGERRLHAKTVISAVVAGLGGVLLVYVPHSAGMDSPYEGLMLFMFGIGCFMGLRFRYVAAVVLMMLAAFVAAELAVGVESRDLANSAFRLTCAALVSIIGGHQLERQARVVYLQRSLLAVLANRDGLTGLANKRRFDEHCEVAARQAAREGKPVSVMIVDVDHFKEYNDSYGHQAGDHCLKELARVLERLVRRPLDLVARYGGEEFVLFFFDTGTEAALQLAAELQRLVSELDLPHAASPVAGQLTLSGGVATRAPEELKSVQDLLREADDGLYRAKANGRNCIVHAGLDAACGVVSGGRISTASPRRSVPMA